MEKEFYTCEFYKTKFIPKRRKIQKFCSPCCRSKNNHNRNKVVKDKSTKVDPSEVLDELQNISTKKIKVEQMSWAGFGNNLSANLAMEGFKAVANAFKAEENKPSTKGDIQKVLDLINTRYFQVHNISADHFGRIPYFDMATSKIVYYDEYQKRFEFPQFDLN